MLRSSFGGVSCTLIGILLLSTNAGAQAPNLCSKVVGVWTAVLNENNEDVAEGVVKSYVIEFKPDGRTIRDGKRSTCKWSCNGNKLDVDCSPAILSVAHVDWIISADGRKLTDENFPRNTASRKVAAAPAAPSRVNPSIASTTTPPTSGGVSAQTYSDVGFAYWFNGKYDDAIREYDQAIRLNPNFAEAFLMRGMAYKAKKQYGRAMQDFDQSIRLNPNDWHPFYERYTVKHRLGDEVGAEADFARSQQLQRK